MTKQQARLLRFLIRYPEGWHSVGPDSRATVKRLAELGLVEWDSITKQARLTRPGGEV